MIYSINLIFLLFIRGALPLRSYLMLRLRIIMAGMAALLTASCGVARWTEMLIEEISQLEAPGGVYFEDEVYKSTPTGDLEMDIYLPDQYTGSPEQAETRYPLYLYIHGGAWIGGHRKMIRWDERVDPNAEPVENPVMMLPQLRAAGIAVVSISYRFLYEVSFNKIAEDVEDAVNFLIANSATYKLNMNRVVIHGQSAGAHLAMQYAFKHSQDNNITILGLIDEYGPTDLVSLSDYTPIFNKNAGMDNGILKLVPKSIRFECSPINLVTSSAPPIFIIHGDRDDIVPLDQTLFLKYKLENLIPESEYDQRIKYRLVEGGDHGFSDKSVGGADAANNIRIDVRDYIIEKLK